MKPISFAVFALCAAAVCSTPKVRAETAAPQAQDATQVQTEAIELRNVKPSVMAYLLDSEHQAEPSDELKMRTSLAQQGVTYFHLVGQRFHVPPQPGIVKDVQLVPDDSSNTLNVSGDPAAIERVRVAVRALDKETPRFEIEARVVQVPLDSPLYRSQSQDKSLPYISTSWNAVKQLEAAGKLRVIEGCTMPILDGPPVANVTASSGRATARFQTTKGFHEDHVTVVKQHLTGFRLGVNDDNSVNLFIQVLDGFRLGESIDYKGRLSEPLPMQSWKQDARLGNGSAVCFSGAPLSFLATQNPPGWLAKLFPASRAPMKGVQLLIVSVRSMPPLDG